MRKLKLLAKGCIRPLTPPCPLGIPPPSGDELQGAAGDCNSPGATHAWFDSRVTHHHLHKVMSDRKAALGRLFVLARMGGGIWLRLRVMRDFAFQQRQIALCLTRVQMDHLILHRT